MTNMMEILREAARRMTEYQRRIDALNTCAADRCNRRQEEVLCIDHKLEADRAAIVMSVGGHNLESYRLHKIRHQSTRGMPKLRG